MWALAVALALGIVAASVPAIRCAIAPIALLAAPFLIICLAYFAFFDE